MITMIELKAALKAFYTPKCTIKNSMNFKLVLEVERSITSSVSPARFHMLP